MDGVNCLKATDPLQGESLLFTTNLPEIFWYSFDRTQMISFEHRTPGLGIHPAP